jgi:hypothetical protein
MKQENAPLIFKRTIATNESFVINLSNPNFDDEGTQTDLYAPLKNMVLFNLSGNANVEYYLNADTSGKLAPTGVIATEENKKINFIRVKNLSSVNQAEVTIQFNNDETLLSLKMQELGIEK